MEYGADSTSNETNFPKRFSVRFAIWVTLVCFVGQPIFSFAGPLVGPLVIPANNRTQVGNTTVPVGTGRPMVNIATPNAAGLSHNQYNQFNVGTPGLVFNNNSSTQSVCSVNAAACNRTVESVNQNPNLTNGSSATVILNEVVTQSTCASYSCVSQLMGPMEVFGTKAAVVIANPYGVTCDGCGFVNTSRGTLTTGTPTYSGGNPDAVTSVSRLQGFNVTTGTINIGAGGLLDASTVQIDLAALGVIVGGRIGNLNNAPLNGPLNIVAGANNINYSDWSATATAAALGNTEVQTIDVTSLGGMYAQQIYLVNTAAGVGVNSVGIIQATNNLNISATGSVSLGGPTAPTNITNASTNAGGTLTVTASSISLQPGAIASTGNMSLTANSGDITNTGKMVSNGTLSLTANNGALNNYSLAQSSHGLTINAQSVDNTSGIVQDSGTGLVSITATTGALNNTQGTVQSKNGLTINAQSVDNTSGLVQDVGNGLLRITAATGALNNTQGTVQSNNGLTINAQSIDNTSGALQSTGTNTTVAGNNGLVNITSTNAFNNNGGTVQSKNGVTLTAKSVDNTAGWLQDIGDGDVSVTATNGALQNIAGTHTISGSAQPGGVIASKNGAVTLAITGDLTNSGVISSATTVVASRIADMNITTSGIFNNSGSIQSAENLLFNFQGSTAQTNALTGQIISTAGNLTIQNASAFTNQGGNGNSAGIYANQGDLSITGSGALINQGILRAACGTDVTCAAGGNVDLTFHSVDNQSNAAIVGLASTTVNAVSSISNDGNANGTGGGTIYAGIKDVVLALNPTAGGAATLMNEAGATIFAGRTVSLGYDCGLNSSGQCTQTVWNVGATPTLVGSGANKTAQVGVTVNNIGNIKSTGDTVVQADVFHNSIVNPGVITTVSPAVITVQGDSGRYPGGTGFTHLGRGGNTYVSGADVTFIVFPFTTGHLWQDWAKDWTVDQTFVSTPSANRPNMVAGGNMTIRTQNGDNVGGTLATAGNITITALDGVSSHGTFLNQAIVAYQYIYEALGRTYYRCNFADAACLTTGWPEDSNGVLQPRSQSDYQYDSAAILNGAIVEPGTSSIGGIIQAQTAGAVAHITIGNFTNISATSLVAPTLGDTQGQWTSAGAPFVWNSIPNVTATSAAVNAYTQAPLNTPDAKNPGIPSGVSFFTNYRLPQGTNGLFIQNQNSSSRYVVIANPLYGIAGQNNISSDWLISQFITNQNQLAAAMALKKLGDGAYEQQLIADQVLGETGLAFIDSAKNGGMMMQTLMANAVSQSKVIPGTLTIGTALTAAQQSALTQDMVWLVSTVINGQSVLVPQLYLATTTLANIAGGQLLADSVHIGKDTNITNIGGTINATGTATADHPTSGTLTMDAGGTGKVTNLSGDIEGASVNINAAQLTNETLVSRIAQGMTPESQKAQAAFTAALAKKARDAAAAAATNAGLAAAAAGASPEDVLAASAAAAAAQASTAAARLPGHTNASVAALAAAAAAAVPGATADSVAAALVSADTRNTSTNGGIEAVALAAAMGISLDAANAAINRAVTSVTAHLNAVAVTAGVTLAGTAAAKAAAALEAAPGASPSDVLLAQSNAAVAQAASATASAAASLGKLATPASIAANVASAINQAAAANPGASAATLSQYAATATAQAAATLKGATADSIATAAAQAAAGMRGASLESIAAALVAAMPGTSLAALAASSPQSSTTPAALAAFSLSDVLAKALAAAMPGVSAAAAATLIANATTAANAQQAATIKNDAKQAAAAAVNSLSPGATAADIGKTAATASANSAAGDATTVSGWNMSNLVNAAYTSAHANGTGAPAGTVLTVASNTVAATAANAIGPAVAAALAAGATSGLTSATDIANAAAAAGVAAGGGAVGAAVAAAYAQTANMFNPKPAGSGSGNMFTDFISSIGSMVENTAKGFAALATWAVTGSPGGSGASSSNTSAATAALISSLTQQYTLNAAIEAAKAVPGATPSSIASAVLAAQTGASPSAITSAIQAQLGPNTNASTVANAVSGAVNAVASAASNAAAAAGTAAAATAAAAPGATPNTIATVAAAAAGSSAAAAATAMIGSTPASIAAAAAAAAIASAKATPGATTEAINAAAANAAAAAAATAATAASGATPASVASAAATAAAAQPGATPASIAAAALAALPGIPFSTVVSALQAAGVPATAATQALNGAIGAATAATTAVAASAATAASTAAAIATANANTVKILNSTSSTIAAATAAAAAAATGATPATVAATTLAALPPGTSQSTILAALTAAQPGVSSTVLSQALAGAIATAKASAVTAAATAATTAATTAQSAPGATPATIATAAANAAATSAATSAANLPGATPATIAAAAAAAAQAAPGATPNTIANALLASLPKDTPYSTVLSTLTTALTGSTAGMTPAQLSAAQAAAASSAGMLLTTVSYNATQSVATAAAAAAQAAYIAAGGVVSSSSSTTTNTQANVPSLGKIGTIMSDGAGPIVSTAAKTAATAATAVAATTAAANAAATSAAAGASKLIGATSASIATATAAAAASAPGATADTTAAALINALPPGTPYNTILSALTAAFPAAPVSTATAALTAAMNTVATTVSTAAAAAGQAAVKAQPAGTSPAAITTAAANAAALSAATAATNLVGATSASIAQATANAAATAPNATPATIAAALYTALPGASYSDMLNAVAAAVPGGASAASAALQTAMNNAKTATQTTALTTYNASLQSGATPAVATNTAAMAAATTAAAAPGATLSSVASAAATAAAAAPAATSAMIAAAVLAALPAGSDYNTMLNAVAAVQPNMSASAVSSVLNTAISAAVTAASVADKAAASAAAAGVAADKAAGKTAAEMAANAASAAAASLNTTPAATLAAAAAAAAAVTAANTASTSAAQAAKAATNLATNVASALQSNTTPPVNGASSISNQISNSQAAGPDVSAAIAKANAAAAALLSGAVMAEVGGTVQRSVVANGGADSKSFTDVANRTATITARTGDLNINVTGDVNNIGGQITSKQGNVSVSAGGSVNVKSLVLESDVSTTTHSSTGFWVFGSSTTSTKTTVSQDQLTAGISGAKDVTVNGQNGVNLKGANIQAGNNVTVEAVKTDSTGKIALDANGNVTATGNVKDNALYLYNGLSTSTTTTGFQSTKSADGSSGQFGYGTTGHTFSETDTQGTGSQIKAGNALTVNAKNINVEGGVYQGQTASLNASNGGSITFTGAAQQHTTSETQMSSMIGIGYSSAGAQGDKKASPAGGGDTPNTMYSASLGFSSTKSATQMQSQQYSNSVLAFSKGINVATDVASISGPGGAFGSSTEQKSFIDIGGVDMASQGKISLQSGTIQSTKQENIYRTAQSESSVSVGISANVHSSLAAGLQEGKSVGSILAGSGLSGLGGASASVGFQVKQASSSFMGVADNVSHIYGNDIEINATASAPTSTLPTAQQPHITAIALNGVDIEASKNAAGTAGVINISTSGNNADITINAARQAQTTNNSSMGFGMSMGASFDVSPVGMLMGMGAGGLKPSVGMNFSQSSSNTLSSTHTNSLLQADGNVTVNATEGNLTLKGVDVSAGDTARLSAANTFTSDVVKDAFSTHQQQTSISLTNNMMDHPFGVVIGSANSGTSSETGNNIAATKTLAISAGSDVTLIGGTYTADAAAITSQTGNVTIKTAQTVSQGSSSLVSMQFVASAAANLAGYGVEMDAGSLSGGQFKTTVLGQQDEGSPAASAVLGGKVAVSADTGSSIGQSFANKQLLLNAGGFTTDSAPTSLLDAQQSAARDVTVAGAFNVTIGDNGKVDPGQLLAAKQGIEIQYNKQTNTDVTNTNAQLVFGKSLDIIAGQNQATTAGNGVVDIGGANMISTLNNSSTGNMSLINVVGQTIQSTKYVDTHVSDTLNIDTFFGMQEEAHSALTSLINHNMTNANNLSQGKYASGGGAAYARAAGEQSIQAIGDMTNLAFGDTLGGSANIAAKITVSASHSATTSENINHIQADSINFTSTSGNINLAGVDMQSFSTNPLGISRVEKDPTTGRNVTKTYASGITLNSAGDLNITAAKSTNEGWSDSFSTGVTVGVNFSSNALTSAAGVGVSAGRDFSLSLGKTNETSYANSELGSASQVTLQSKGNTTIVGGAVNAKDVALKVGGTLGIASVQDTKDNSTITASLSGSLGASLNSTTLVAPMGSIQLGGGKEWDNSARTTEQSGITAQNSLSGSVGGNMNLLGAHVVSLSGQGALFVAGTVNAKNLEDKQDKDGVTITAGGGISADLRPTINLGASTPAAIHYQATNNATVAGVNLVAQGGINGTLNTLGSQLLNVTQDDKIQAFDMAITIDVGVMASKVKGLKTTAKVEQKPDQPDLQKTVAPPKVHAEVDVNPNSPKNTDVPPVVLKPVVEKVTSEVATVAPPKLETDAKPPVETPVPTIAVEQPTVGTLKPVKVETPVVKTTPEPPPVPVVNLKPVMELSPGKPETLPIATVQTKPAADTAPAKAGSKSPPAKETTARYMATADPAVKNGLTKVNQLLHPTSNDSPGFAGVVGVKAKNAGKADVPVWDAEANGGKGATKIISLKKSSDVNDLAGQNTRVLVSIPGKKSYYQELVYRVVDSHKSDIDIQTKRPTDLPITDNDQLQTTATGRIFDVETGAEIAPPSSPTVHVNLPKETANGEALVYKIATVDAAGKPIMRTVEPSELSNGMTLDQARSLGEITQYKVGVDGKESPYQQFSIVEAPSNQMKSLTQAVDDATAALAALDPKVPKNKNAISQLKIKLSKAKESLAKETKKGPQFSVETVDHADRPAPEAGPLVHAKDGDGALLYDVSVDAVGGHTHPTLDGQRLSEGILSAALKNAPITRVNDPNTVLGQATHTLVSPTKGTGDTTHSVKPATESSLVDGTPVVHSVTDLPAKDSEGRSITYKDSKGNEINTEQLQKLTPQEITSLKLTANVVDNSGTSVTIAKVRFAEDGQGNMQAKVKMDKDNATVAGADVPKTTADGQLLYKVGTVDNGEHSHPIATSEMTIQEIQKLVSEPVPIFQNGVKVGEAHYVDPIVNGVLDPARLENGALKLNTTVKGGAVKSTLATEYKVNAKKVELPTTDSYGKQVTYTVTDSDGVTKPFTKDDLVKMSPTDLIKKPLNITQVDSSGHKVDIEFSTTDGGKTITVKTAGEDSRPAPESVMVHARNEKGQKLYTVEVEPSASGNTHAPITEQVTASDFAEGGKYSKLDVMKGDTKISEVSHQVTETTAGAVLDHKGDEVGAAPTTPTVNRPTEVQSTEDAGHHVIVKLPEINTDTGKPVRYEIKNANGEVVAQSKLTDGTLSPDEAHGLVIKQIDTESGKAIGTMTLAKTGTGNDVAVDGTKTVLDPDALSLGTKHASDEGGNKLYDVTLPESYKPSGELKAKLDAMGFVPGQKMTMTEGQIQHVFGVTEDSLIQTKNAKVASAKEDLDKAQSDYEVTIKTAALKQAIQEANHAIAMSKPTVMQMGADKSGHPTTVRLSVTTADGGEINLSAELHDTNPNHLPERSVKPGEKFTATDPATGRTVEVVVQKNGAFKIQKSVGQSIKDTAASIFNKKSEYLKNLANLPNEAAGGLQHLLTDQRNLPDSIFSNQRGMNAQDRAISGAVATVKKYDAAKKALQKADDALVNSHIVVLDGDPVAQAKLQKLQNAVASAKAQVEKRAAQKDVAQAIINAARTPAYNGWTFTDASGKTFTGAVQHNDDGTLSHFSLIPEASSAVTPKGTTAVPPSKSPAKTSALPGSSGGNPEELPQPKAAAVAPQEEGGMFNNKVGPASDGVLPVVKKPSFLQKIFSKTNRVGVEATVSDAQAPVTTASSSPEVSSSPAATNKAIARATADQIRQQGAWNNNASDVVMKVAADSLGQTVKIEDVAGNTPAAHTTFMPSSTSDANPNTGAPLTLKRVMVIDPDGHQSPHYIAVVNGLDVPIRADGDCLYRALIVLRNGLSSDNDVTSEQIQALRDQIATTIERSPEAYAPFITPDILGNGGSPPPKL